MVVAIEMNCRHPWFFDKSTCRCQAGRIGGKKQDKTVIAGINTWRRMTRINPPRLIDWRQRHTALSPIHDGVALDPNLSPQRADAIRWITIYYGHTALTQFEMGKDMPVLV